MKLLRQIIATPFLLIGLLCGFIAQIVWGEGYFEQVMKMSKDLHKFFHNDHDDSIHNQFNK